MDFWSFLQIVIDIILLVIIYFYLIRDKNRRITPRFEELNEERFNLLSDAISQISHESKKALDDMRKDLDKEKRSLQQVLRKSEAKREELNRSIQEANQSLSGFIKLISGNHKNSDMDNDKYAQAMKLADKGFSADEIAKKIQLPTGEVELLLGLKN